MKFSDLIQNVQLRPRLVRPQQAALLLGSGEVVADFIAAGWLQPVLSEHKLVLYSLQHLERCVARLEAGEFPEPDGHCQKPKPPGQLERTASQTATKLSFADQLRGMVWMPPLLLRPEQAAAILGSVELLDEMRLSDWIHPVYSKHRLTLFSVRHLDACVARLEAGHKPGEYGDGEPPAPETPAPAVEIPKIKSNGRVFRKTRRPMPADAKLIAS